MDSKTDDIHNRLRGLCDNVERETFIDHEITYSLVSSTGAKVQLRVSRSLAQSKMPWQLKVIEKLFQTKNYLKFSMLEQLKQGIKRVCCEIKLRSGAPKTSHLF